MQVQYDLFEKNDEISLLKKELNLLKLQIEFMRSDCHVRFQQMGKLILKKESKKMKNKS